MEHYNPSKFPRNEARQEEFDTLMDAIGEYAIDNFLGMGAWYLYTLQVVPIVEFAKEYVNELENWRYRVIPGVVAESPDDEEVQKISCEPLTVRELGFFMQVLQHPSTCCIAHGVIAFDKLRPYIPKQKDFGQPGPSDNLVDILSQVFGAPAQEIAPGITAIVVPLNGPDRGADDKAFENFLNTGETPTDS